MPYKVVKQSCTRSDGKKGKYVLKYKPKKKTKKKKDSLGFVKAGCHTSKKNASGQRAAIEGGPRENHNRGKTMKITKRKLKQIIKEEYSRILKEQNEELPASMTNEDISRLNKVWRLAQDGYKLIVKGRRGSLYTGIGNREGLHGFARKLANEKWERGQMSLFRKLKTLQVGDRIQEKQSRREIYNTATWTQGLFDLFQSINSPKEVEEIFRRGW